MLLGCFREGSHQLENICFISCSLCTVSRLATCINTAAEKLVICQGTYSPLTHSCFPAHTPLFASYPPLHILIRNLHPSPSYKQPLIHLISSSLYPYPLLTHTLVPANSLIHLTSTSHILIHNSCILFFLQTVPYTPHILPHTSLSFTYTSSFSCKHSLTPFLSSCHSCLISQASPSSSDLSYVFPPSLYLTPC